jgi:hypothetical protein
MLQRGHLIEQHERALLRVGRRSRRRGGECREIHVRVNPSTGVSCIALAAGIDLSQTGLVATPDFATDATFFGTNAEQAIVEWRSDAFNCPPGLLQVITGIRSVVTVGSPDGDVRSVDNTLAHQAFFFVVP